MSAGLFQVIWWFFRPAICLSCFVLRVPCFVSGGVGGGGGEGTVTWGMFPRGCKGTVARRCFLFKGGGGNVMVAGFGVFSESRVRVALPLGYPTALVVYLCCVAGSSPNIRNFPVWLHFNLYRFTRVPLGAGNARGG